MSFQLYKNVFCPDVGHTLAFIGLVQPASGGSVSMAEMQARWFSQLTLGNLALPGAAVMNKIIDKDIVSGAVQFAFSLLKMVCTRKKS